MVIKPRLIVQGDMSTTKAILGSLKGNDIATNVGNSRKELYNSDYQLH
jgi:hypothetical protein